MAVAARYVNREMFAVFCVTLLLLLLVAVGGRFIGYLQEAALGKFTGSAVLTIITLRLPEFIQLVAPFALYVAVLLTFGRLYAEQEMVVLQSAGAGTSRLLSWSGITIGGVTLGVAVLSLYATPLSQRMLVDFMAVERAQTEFETVNPGIFHAYDRGRRVTYSEAMSDDRRILYNVFMSQRMEDGREALIWAEQGTQEVDASGTRYLVLEQGHRYERAPTGGDYRVVEFDQLSQRLSTNERPSTHAVEAQSTFALGTDVKSRAEWHWRIALPLFCIVGGMLGLGVSRVKPRQGRFTRVVPGMLLMLLYYLSLLLFHNAINEESMPAWIGLWPVHMAFAGFACWQLWRLGKPVKA